MVKNTIIALHTIKMRKRKLYTAFLFVCICFLMACSESEVNPVKYCNYIGLKDNGLRQIQCENSYCYELKYLPQEYEILRRNSGIKSETAFKEELQTVENNLFFLLKLTGENKVLMDQIKQQKSNNWEKTLNDLRFKMQQNFKVVLQNDTFPCVLYQLEQGAFAQQEMQFSLLFDIPKAIDKAKKNDFKLIINDTILCKKNMVFDISNTTIAKIPSIKF